MEMGSWNGTDIRKPLEELKLCMKVLRAHTRTHTYTQTHMHTHTYTYMHMHTH